MYFKILFCSYQHRMYKTIQLYLHGMKYFFIRIGLEIKSVSFYLQICKRSGCHLLFL